jgi:nitrate reductase gamma subunit
MEEVEVVEQDEVDSSWKLKTILAGGILGALVGVGAAFLLTRRAEQKGTQLAITPAKGVQLGVMITGLLRSILTLGDE